MVPAPTNQVRLIGSDGRVQHCIDILSILMDEDLEHLPLLNSTRPFVSHLRLYFVIVLIILVVTTFVLVSYLVPIVTQIHAYNSKFSKDLQLLSEAYANLTHPVQ